MTTTVQIGRPRARAKAPAVRPTPRRVALVSAPFGRALRHVVDAVRRAL